ncbi:glycine cleavage H-protein [Acidianus hospitalis W1]|uniref:Probable glycine cleavage system H protein n=1 Tax=Acidianus hospitalis (strain W1) TaxID=933801 RepID=F4B6E1_ACIHW|nr:glycine cleavage system protein H [Acidianus hospitalis]AEE94561.1 glycine cleavage H-protein [Acidianus hospitalis W1]
MNISGFEFPEELLYDEEKHVWIKKEKNNVISIGITSLGQYMAGKIFQVSTKEVGEKVTPKSTLFSIESAKWVGKFRLPITGEIIAVNENVIKDPSIINEKPYDAWIIKVRVESIDERRFKTINEAYEKFKEEAEKVVK